MEKQHSSIESKYVEIDGLRLHIAERKALNPRTATDNPLLLFNGIGANLELCFPLMEQLPNVTTIIFDMPGVGASDTPRFPMRFNKLAALSGKLLDQLGYDEVDVLGVSWGGALAQVFAHQFPDRCHRLILAATSPGAIMIPGKLSVLMKLGSPSRYIDSDYMQTHAHNIYGGLLRKRPELVDHFTSMLKSPGSRIGYYWQLMAAVGWTSIHWLHQLQQPTLILAGNDDPIVPIMNAKIMNYRIPFSRMVELDCGHLFLFTMVEDVARTIIEFLSTDDSLYNYQSDSPSRVSAK